MSLLIFFLFFSRFSLDHPGTRPLSAGPSLGPEHPGTRLATPRCGVKSFGSSRFCLLWSSLLNLFFFQHAVHQLTIQALFKLQVFIIAWRDNWRVILSELSCRPSSRNGKYTNGVAGGGGGYPGIQNMAYSPAYSNGVSCLKHIPRSGDW